MSNIFVYAVTFFLLQFKACPDDPNNNNLTPDDAPKFMILTFVVCGVGVLFQLLFHFGTKEDNSMEEYQRIERASSFVMQKSLNWKGYLKTGEFYQVFQSNYSFHLIKYGHDNYFKDSCALHVYKINCQHISSILTNVYHGYGGFR